MKQILYKWMEFLKRNLCRIWNWLAFHWQIIVICLLSCCLILGICWYCIRYTSPDEMSLRKAVITTAQVYLGCNEADGTHKQIVDRYNRHEPRARDYEVTYEDSWCAVFTSVVAMQTHLTHIIPLECSCGQQIQLFQQLGRWEERDWYLPKPGDYIYYDWNSEENGDCLGWPEHVGIVVQTIGPVIQVIEGNKDDQVCYRYIFVNDPTVRGYGLPDYGSVIQ